MSSQNVTKTATFTLTSNGTPVPSRAIDFQHAPTPASGQPDVWVDDGTVLTDANGVSTKQYTETPGTQMDFQAEWAGDSSYAATGFKQVLAVSFQASTAATFTVQ